MAMTLVVRDAADVNGNASVAAFVARAVSRPPSPHKQTTHTYIYIHKYTHTVYM